MSGNMFVLVGRVGDEFDLKESRTTGKPWAKFTFKTVRTIKGEREVSLLPGLVVFGGQCQKMANNLDREMMIIGRLNGDTYEYEGKTRHSLKVVVDEVTILGEADYASAAPQAKGSTKAAAAAPADDEPPF